MAAWRDGRGCDGRRHDDAAAGARDKSEIGRGVVDNDAMERGCEGQWSDGTRVRGTMARWDAGARNYGAMGRVGEEL